VGIRKEMLDGRRIRQRRRLQKRPNPRNDLRLVHRWVALAGGWRMENGGWRMVRLLRSLDGEAWVVNRELWIVIRAAVGRES
jgi:hypothetical protein